MTRETIEMRDITRSATAIGVGVLCVLALSLPAAAAGPAGAVAPSDTEPGTTEPAPPETTVPDDSTPEESIPDDTLVGAGNPDDDVNATVAAIAVVGFVILLGVASWWMVRRSNPDAQPMPPQGGPPSSDLI
jgi:hypothetical protein